MVVEADVIVVALGFDAAYIAHAAAAIASIVHTAQSARFRFLLLYTGVGAGQRAKLERVAPAASFSWIEIKDEDVPAFQDHMHFSRAILFRLGLEKLAPPDVDRVIYLDCDLIVLSDLSDLWRTELKGDVLGAVAQEYAVAAEFARQWDLPIGSAYFNSGVLLIDLAAVRASRAFSAAMEFLKCNAARVRWQDQDALNWVCWGRWRPLDSAWNVQRTNAIRRPGAAARIAHFTGAEKPWIRDAYHPWAWAYWRALRSTPFFWERVRAVGLGAVLRAWLRWQRCKPRIQDRKEWLAPPALDASVIVSASGGAERLRACLRSVAAMDSTFAWEAIVIDAAESQSVAGVVEEARGSFPAPISYQSGDQTGWAQARNAGTIASRGRVLLYLEDDCLVPMDLVTRAVSTIDADGACGWITASVDLAGTRRYRAHAYTEGEGAIGAFLALRRKAAQEIGPLETSNTKASGRLNEEAAARASASGWDGLVDAGIAVRRWGMEDAHRSALAE